MIWLSKISCHVNFLSLVQSKAGLRVFDRMEVWALTAVKGGPYQPVSRMQMKNEQTSQCRQCLIC